MNRSIPVFLLFCPALLLFAALPVQAGEAYSPPVNECFPNDGLLGRYSRAYQLFLGCLVVMGPHQPR